MDGRKYGTVGWGGVRVLISYTRRSDGGLAAERYVARFGRSALRRAEIWSKSLAMRPETIARLEIFQVFNAMSGHWVGDRESILLYAIHCTVWGKDKNSNRAKRQR